MKRLKSLDAMRGFAVLACMHALGLLFGMMIFVTAGIWITLYFYSKWRWGSPSSW